MKAEVSFVRMDLSPNGIFVKHRIKRFCSVLFLTYLLTVIYLTLFTFNYYVYGKSVNLVMFDSIRLMLRSHSPMLILKNILGNVLLFFPYGFFLPLFFKRFRSFSQLLGIGFLSSLLIESCQYEFAQRIFDVDDLMLNTVGAILGWIVFKIVKWVSVKF
ncbi:VanZ family protein [Pullulanibacillus sp. KACC 23026]|uniref:VanZ family protein n=1 Tax=Pullulanibacillus sp. KACC 23026 TaxID=3028315 RepID=UPI0023AF6A25|nr:VanZ family protein [Pullulanibacillus sp. KACC 23026]WEG12290.1 VanZ family protein [Pullulanibacillus sp. KACC 23026]